jgi:hypothetical protein
MNVILETKYDIHPQCSPILIIHYDLFVYSSSISTFPFTLISQFLTILNFKGIFLNIKHFNTNYLKILLDNLALFLTWLSWPISIAWHILHSHKCLDKDDNHT